MCTDNSLRDYVSARVWASVCSSASSDWSRCPHLHHLAQQWKWKVSAQLSSSIYNSDKVPKMQAEEQKYTHQLFQCQKKELEKLIALCWQITGSTEEQKTVNRTCKGLGGHWNNRCSRTRGDFTNYPSNYPSVFFWGLILSSRFDAVKQLSDKFVAPNAHWSHQRARKCKL